MGRKKYDESLGCAGALIHLFCGQTQTQRCGLCLCTPHRHTLQQQWGRINTLSTTNVLITASKVFFFYRIPCQYLHRCIKCNGGHPMISCLYDIGNLQLQSSTQYANKQVRGVLLKSRHVLHQHARQGKLFPSHKDFLIVPKTQQDH